MVEYSAEELAALKKEHAANATDEQFTLWLMECRTRGLTPVRDVLLQVRTTEEWDGELRAKVKKKKAIYVTTIGAFRRIAESTGKYVGQRPSKWIYLDKEGKPTIESEIPLPDPASDKEAPLRPWAVRSTILRKDFAEPLSVVLRFWSVAQTKNDGGLTSMWLNRGVEQLEKSGEAAALRRAYPGELGGLFISEEVERELPNESPAEPTPVSAAPKAPVVPKVNHIPAVATSEPRPGADKVAEVLQPRIEDVILDRPATPPTVQKMDKPAEKPKKPTAKEKADAALNAEHDSMMAAIDNEIAKNNDPLARLPTPEERTENSARVRKLLALGMSASEKSALQRYVEAGKPLAEKLQADWNKVLTQLEAAGTKEAILKIIAIQPGTEEQNETF